MLPLSLLRARKTAEIWAWQKKKKKKLPNSDKWCARSGIHWAALGEELANGGALPTSKHENTIFERYVSSKPVKSEIFATTRVSNFDRRSRNIIDLTFRTTITFTHCNIHIRKYALYLHEFVEPIEFVNSCATFVHSLREPLAYYDDIVTKCTRVHCKRFERKVRFPCQRWMPADASAPRVRAKGEKLRWQEKKNSVVELWAARSSRLATAAGSRHRSRSDENRYFLIHSNFVGA